MKTKNNIEIGKRIHSLRIQSGFSSAQLADKLGISHQQVRKYEIGQDRVSVERLMQISEVLQISLEEFFNDIDSITFDKKVSARLNKSMHKLFNKLTPEAQKNLIAFLQNAVEMEKKHKNKNLSCAS